MTGGEMISTPDEWAARYGITLADHERWLLRTRKSQLDAASRQQAYRLLLALRPESCPYCRWPVCERSTWTGPIPIPASTPNNGPGYKCPNCGHEMIHYQGHASADRHHMEPVPADPPLAVERVQPGAPPPGQM